MMIKVESLKDYESLRKEEFLKLATKIYKITASLEKDYPQYKEWYFLKQLPAITKKERNIFFIRSLENSKEIIGMTCLKKDKEEQKICTLYIADKYRHLGFGTILIEKAFVWLGTTKPLITITDYKLEMFIPLIEKYDWELTEIIKDLYGKHTTELCFNDTLTKKTKIIKFNDNKGV